MNGNHIEHTTTLVFRRPARHGLIHEDETKPCDWWEQLDLELSSAERAEVLEDTRPYEPVPTLPPERRPWLALVLAVFAMTLAGTLTGRFFAEASVPVAEATVPVPVAVVPPIDTPPETVGRPEVVEVPVTGVCSEACADEEPSPGEARRMDRRRAERRARRRAQRHARRADAPPVAAVTETSDAAPAMELLAEPGF